MKLLFLNLDSYNPEKVPGQQLNDTLDSFYLIILVLFYFFHLSNKGYRLIYIAVFEFTSLIASF